MIDTERLCRYLADPVEMILREFVLPSGNPYADSVQDWQRDFFRAMFAVDPDGRPEHRLCYSERRRGESKTEDCAAAALADLITGPARHRSYAVAASSDQAQLLVDSVRGFVGRSEILAGIEVERARVINRATDSQLVVLSAEDRTAYGVRPRRVYFDELSLQRDEALWGAMWSAIGKSPLSQMIAVSMAGFDFSSVGWRIRELARTTDSYFFQSREGSEPAPWLPDLAEQERTLHPADYRRLWQVVWSEPEGSWISREMWDQVEVGRESSRQEVGARCVGAVDVGIVHDATAIAVAHKERDRDGTERIVLDCMRTLQGSRQAPVELEAIEDEVEELTRRYNVRRWVFEAPQAVGSVQRLQRRLQRSRVESRFPTAESMARIFGVLYRLVTNRGLVTFPHERLRREALGLHLRQVGGRLKVVDSGSVHQDHVVALAIAADVLDGEQPWTREATRKLGELQADLRASASRRGGYAGLGAAGGSMRDAGILPGRLP